MLIDSNTYQIAHSEKEERTHMTAPCNSLNWSFRSKLDSQIRDTDKLYGSCGI